MLGLMRVTERVRGMGRKSGVSGRVLLAVTALGIALPACGGGPKAVRGDDVAGLDDEAFSTGLDRRDLQKLLHKNMDALQTSAVIERWKGEDRPTVAVLPMRNDTSEHIDGALSALISEVETTLVNAGHVRVISQESQGGLIDEVKRQQSDVFDAATVSRWGHQVGARYFVTGKVYTVDERGQGERRVQYFMFMRVLDSETSDLLWQNTAELTKAIVK
jgi:penicillin-binding protein activator